MLSNDEILSDVELQAQQMVKDFVDSGDAEHFGELFKSDDSVLEALLFIIFQEAVASGDLTLTQYLHQATPEEVCELFKDCQCGDCESHENHLPASPVFLAPAIVLRHMMFSAMTIGMKYQKDTSKLENIWGTN